MTNTNLPAANHADLSHGYADGAPGSAHLTTAYFVLGGIVHRAVRFWRTDYRKSGGIEIYTLEPYAAEHTTCTELGWYLGTAGDMLRYAREDASAARVDVAAMAAIAAASKGTYTSAHADSAARVAGLELA